MVAASTAPRGLDHKERHMRTTRIITVLLAALLTAAILAGPAAAVPTDVVSGGSTSPDPGPVVLRTVEASGFDWGSAGIGAAAGIGAFAIVLAGTAGMRRRRPARPQTIATH
jgi:hypothetical protein